MKISVITAVYNNEDTIEDTITSVIAQTHHDIEYILIDGKSTDDTLNIINKYKDNVDTIISEPDGGIYEALNKGIANSTGDVVCFLHSDDIYAHENVLKNVNELFERSEVDSIYGDLVYVKKGNINKIVRYWKSGVFKHSKLKRGWMPAHPTFFVKRKIYEKHGGFDTSFRIAADYDKVLCFLGVHKITTSYLSEVLVKMRLGGESNKSFKNLRLKTAEDLKALRKNKVGGYRTIFMKNFSKLPQFFKRN